MPCKAIHINKNDERTWKEAETILGGEDRLSEYLTEVLRQVVQENIASKEIREIEFEFYEVFDPRTGKQLRPRTVSFYGRWLIPDSNPMESQLDDVRDTRYAVAR